MSKEDPFDFYDLDDLLSEGERNLRNRVRRFVDEECLPTIAEYFEKGVFPQGLIPRLAEMGLFGLHVEGYGGHRVNHTTYGLICLELGRCDSGLRALVSVQNSLVMIPSMSSVPTNRRKNGFPDWREGKPSAASRFRSRISARTRPPWLRAPKGQGKDSG